MYVFERNKNVNFFIFPSEAPEKSPVDGTIKQLPCRLFKSRSKSVGYKKKESLYLILYLFIKLTFMNNSIRFYPEILLKILVLNLLLRRPYEKAFSFK